MSRNDREQCQSGGHVFVFVHPSQRSTIPMPLYATAKGNGKEKGSEALLGEHHRAGAIRPPIQVGQNTNSALRTSVPSVGDFLCQLLLLPTLLVAAICQPAFFSAEGQRNR